MFIGQLRGTVGNIFGIYFTEVKVSGSNTTQILSFLCLIEIYTYNYVFKVLRRQISILNENIAGQILIAAALKFTNCFFFQINY